MKILLILIFSLFAIKIDVSKSKEIKPYYKNNKHSYSNSEELKPIKSKTLEGNLNSQIIFLADQLENNLKKEYKNLPTVITTFLNLNNLNQAGKLGRLLAENLQHELTVRNWNIIEEKVAKKIYMDNKGEYVLSRDVDKLKAKCIDIENIITGTYTVVGEAVLVNAKLIRYSDGKILSVGQMVIPYGKYIDLFDEENQRVINIVGE